MRRYSQMGAPAWVSEHSRVSMLSMQRSGLVKDVRPKQDEQIVLGKAPHGE